MANWGGLNNALASWRTGLDALLPGRSTRSDGARADGNHASSSEHQADSDGTVDAFDEDRNFLGSADQDGNASEDRIHAALNEDFMADPRAHLIISDRKIRNSEIGDWRPRDYAGSPHTEHTHRQAHQSLEDDGRPWKFPRTRAVLFEIGLDAMTPAQLQDAICDALESDRGQASLKRAAGVGVHGQQLFRSGVDFATAAINTVRAVERIERLVTPPPTDPPE